MTPACRQRAELRGVRHSRFREKSLPQQTGFCMLRRGPLSESCCQVGFAHTGHALKKDVFTAADPIASRKFFESVPAAKVNFCEIEILKRCRRRKAGHREQHPLPVRLVLRLFRVKSARRCAQQPSRTETASAASSKSGRRCRQQRRTSSTPQSAAPWKALDAHSS